MAVDPLPISRYIKSFLSREHLMVNHDGQSGLDNLRMVLTAL